jgi:hypothetical protein
MSAQERRAQRCLDDRHWQIDISEPRLADVLAAAVAPPPAS